MKIYVATDGSYSDYHIERVFLDKEKAIAYCACMKCNFEEYDSADDDSEVRKDIEIYDYVSVILNDNPRVVLHNYRDYKKPDEIKKEYSGINYWISFSVRHGTSDEQIKKIAYDKFAQWKAEREGV